MPQDDIRNLDELKNVLVSDPRFGVYHVTGTGDGWVEVSLIPETLERTNLGEAQAGSRLNVESDVVAKYVERLVSPFAGKERT